MNLVEVGTLVTADFPVGALREHLRLGTGFGEDALQDDVLEGFLRAAVAAVEARTGKVLLSREFLMTLSIWRTASGQDLPVAPVTAIGSVILRDQAGAAEPLDLDSIRLIEDQHHPSIRSLGFCLPTIPLNGEAEIGFTAGYGAWADVPEDLKQAVLLLAAHYYEFRSETTLSQGCMPFGVTSLLERYRPIRLRAGAVT